MKQYNKIMSVFTTTITKLEKVIAVNTVEEQKKTEQIRNLKAEAVALEEESTACAKAVDKIKELLT